MKKFDFKNYLLKKSLLALMLLPNSGIMAALDNALSDSSTPLERSQGADPDKLFDVAKDLSCY